MKVLEYVETVERELKKANKAQTEYWNGHKNRFELMAEMCRELPDVYSVAEVGTAFPFVGLLFPDAYLRTLDMLKSTGKLCEHEIQDFNIERPTLLDNFDLVVCTEVMEHLYCDLYKFAEGLAGRTRKYLLLSFPCGGNGSMIGYDTDLQAPESNDGIGHVREFTQAKAEEFVETIQGFSVKDRQSVPYTPLYRATIVIYLLKKD